MPFFLKITPFAKRAKQVQKMYHDRVFFVLRQRSLATFAGSGMVSSLVSHRVGLRG